MFVLVAGTLVLLWQLLGQTSSSSNTAYSQFLFNVQPNTVQGVPQEQSPLTVTPKNGGATYTVTVPPILTNVLQDMQTAAKVGNVTLAPDVFAAKEAPDTSWIGLAVTTALPLLLTVRFILFIIS